MQKNRHDLLSIGEVAQPSSLTVATIRFYEEKNLIFSLRTNGISVVMHDIFYVA